MKNSAREKTLAEELARLKSRVAELEDLAELGRQCQVDLRRQQGFSDTVLNSMRDAVYVVSARDYKIIDCNEVFLKRYRLKREDVIGKTCYEIKRGRSAPCPLVEKDCPSLKSFITGDPSSMERVVELPSGGKRFYECYALPVTEDGGRVSRLVHIDRDITGRKSTEIQLRDTLNELSRSYAFLSNIIDSSQDAIITADRKGKILTFNRAASIITGYTEFEAVNHIDIRDIYPGDGALEIMAMLRSEDHGGKGKLDYIESQIITKEGNRVPIGLSASVVFVEEAEVASVGFFYDLREKRHMEEELGKTRTQLLQAEKMASIGKLAAGVAHQLNNPLSGITLFGHMLISDYDLEPRAKEDVKRILDNAERSRDTVKELLQFARQTSQEVVLSNINTALARTLFLLEKQSLFHNIEIVKHFDESLPSVPADLQQLYHVFMNILLNAADAMEGGGRIGIRTYLCGDDPFLAVDFTDTGPGIPEESLPHLFEPFYTTKEEGKGTGLGLSVVYGIIENHGGKIEARNLPGGGACFTVMLPLSVH